MLTNGLNYLAKKMTKPQTFSLIWHAYDGRCRGIAEKFDSYTSAMNAILNVYKPDNYGYYTICLLCNGERVEVV